MEEPSTGDELGAREIVDSDSKKSREECPCVTLDVVDGGEDSEAACRICHLSGKDIDQGVDQLMEIGCGCRGELGVAHVQCAEAWFNVKGNLCCEICGETAKNITGTSNASFMEAWNDGPDAGVATLALSGGAARQRWLQGKYICNLLLVLLVILFIFPWFFRGNLF